MIPLVIVDGLVQQLNPSDRLDVARLSIGSPELVNVTGPTITVNKSFIRVLAPANTNVDTILGGQPGDVLIIYGNNVTLKKNIGNIIMPKDIKLSGSSSTILVHVGPNWINPGGA